MKQKLITCGMALVLPALVHFELPAAASSPGNYPNQIVGAIDLSCPGAAPWSAGGIYLNSDDSRLYVAYWEDHNGSRVQEYDLTDNSLIQTISFCPNNACSSCVCNLTTCYHTHADVVLSADDRYLFTINYYPATISRIDLQGGYARTDLPVCSSWPADMDITPDKSKILVKVGQDGRSYDMNNDRIAIFDVTSFSMLACVPLNDEPADKKIGFSSDGTKAYVTTNRRKSSSAMLYVISLQPPYNVLDTVPIPGGSWPNWCVIGIQVTNSKVYVSDCYNSQVLVFDSSLNRIDSILVGGNPSTLAVTPDGCYLYALNLSQFVSIIDV
ncbi:MAG: YncE family protein, partial [Candidatus Zixiibacteriota bacterium]